MTIIIKIEEISHEDAKYFSSIGFTIYQFGDKYFLNDEDKPKNDW